MNMESYKDISAEGASHDSEACAAGFLSGNYSQSQNEGLTRANVPIEVNYLGEAPESVSKDDCRHVYKYQQLPVPHDIISAIQKRDWSQESYDELSSLSRSSESDDSMSSQYLGESDFPPKNARHWECGHLNRKIGRRSRQVDGKERSKKTIRAHRVWLDTQDPVANERKGKCLGRSKHVVDRDEFLQPEGMIQDAVTRLAMAEVKRRVTSSAKVLVPRMVSEISQLVATLNLMSVQSSWQRSMQTMYIYLSPRAASTRDTTEDITRAMRTAFGDAFLSRQAAMSKLDTEEEKEETEPALVSWLGFMRSIRSNWDTAKIHPLFINFTKVVAVLCYSGIHSIDETMWSHKVLEGVMPGVSKMCSSSANMLEAVLDVVEYISQAASIYLETGDLSSALADKDKGGLVSEVARIVANHASFCVGVLSMRDENSLTDDEHYQDVLGMVVRLKRLVESSRNPIQQRLFAKQLIEFEQMLTTVRSRVERSPSRMQPWACYLNGTPGGGKSTLMPILAKACIETIEGETFDQRAMYERNSTDAYWSKARSDMQVITFNDVGASRDEAVLRRQYEEMLRTTDVARYYVPMPEAHEKGAVDVNNWITLASGNGIFPNVGACVNDTGALSRRYSLAPFVKPKDEFCSIDASGNKYLDTGKIEEARVKGKFEGMVYDEVADIFMYETKPTANGITSVPIQMQGLHKMTILQFITIMAADFRAHYLNQVMKLKALSSRHEVEFDAMSEFNRMFPDNDQQVSRTKDRFLDTSEVQQEIDDLQQKEKPHLKTGYKGRRLDAIVEPSWSDYYAEELARCEEECLHTEGVLNWAKPHSAKPHSLNYNDIVSLGAMRDEFESRWSWVPKFARHHWWIPRWLLARMVPADRKKINHACSQNLLLWNICSWTLCLGPVGLLCPFWLATASAMVLGSLGSICVIDTSRRLHDTCMQPAEGLWLATNWRQVHVARIAGVAGLIILACQVFKKIHSATRDLVAEGAQCTKFTLSDPTYRTLGHNPWNKDRPIVDRSFLSQIAKTTISDDLLPVIDRVLYAGHILRNGEEVGTIMAFVFHTGYILVPAHYLRMLEEWILQKRERSNTRFQLLLSREKDKKGAAFKCEIDLPTCYYIPDSDMAVLKVDRTGKMPNMIKHFPLRKESLSVVAVSCSRKFEEDIVFEAAYTQVSRYVNVQTVGRYIGFDYTRRDHYVGLCGAPVIARGNHSHIMGFHTAGDSLHSRQCIASIVTQQDLQDAMAHFQKIDPSAMSPMSEGSIDLVKSMSGFKADEPHYKSAVRYVPDDAQFTVLGVTGKGPSFVSNARPTVIVKAVEKHCSINASDYNPPKANPRWYGPQQNLSSLAETAEDFPLEALLWARKDLWSSIHQAALSRNHEHRALTRFEIINGTGKMYEDPINRNSVWGKPLEGAKREKMFINNDPDFLPNPEYEGPRWDFDPAVHELLDECEEMYRQRKTITPVFTSCIKDEVHYQRLDKARSFEVAPLPITMIGRKLTLKSSSFLRLITESSECTVGSNCHGPDGTLLHAHMTKNGKDRLIAGDFSKFDKRMPVSITMQSLSIYRQLMKDFWQEDDLDDLLNMFDAWCHDVAYPTLDFFGDVIQLRTGGMPSGIPITADLNGLNNSIIHRVCYYLSYQEMFGRVDDIPSFQSKVALLTYGDDSAGSVCPTCSWFNMEVMSKYCEKYGMKYTDPEKSSTVPKFLPYEKLDFLKRNFNRVHECGENLGALSVSSIYKPLCMVLWDKDHHFNEYELAAEVVKSSMYEAFNHGFEFYEMHRSRMKLVCEETGIAQSCAKELGKSFNDRMEAWFLQYGEQAAYIRR